MASTTNKLFALCSLVLVFVLLGGECTAFSPRQGARPSNKRSLGQPTTSSSSHPYSNPIITTAAGGFTTIEAPTKEGIDQDQDILGNPQENTEDAMRRQGPLEYLEDYNESREMDDPFHILLMDQTFEKPKISIAYVAQSLEYVLDMPHEDALEHAQFAHDNGFSCLGTWSREECLSLGKQLQIRDIVCRVVPYCEGGQRGWQAKDANENSSSGASSAGDGNFGFS